MTRVRRGGVVVVVVGLFVLVMIAAAVQGTPRISPIGGTPEPRPADTLPEAPGSSGTPTPEPLAPNPVGELVGAIILGVLIVLAAAGVVALIVWAIRVLLGAWRDRPLRRRDGEPVGLEAAYDQGSSEPEAVAAAVQRGIAGALREIDDRRVPADAIIAAWVGLEESAGDAGVIRGSSETPGEFTVRIITRRGTISVEAETLLRLYERVRFGGYAAIEDDRVAARTALQRIEEEWR